MRYLCAEMRYLISNWYCHFNNLKNGPMTNPVPNRVVKFFSLSKIVPDKYVTNFMQNGEGNGNAYK